MPKPKKIMRPVRKNLSFPEDLAARVDLMLYSELEQKIPHGAWQGFLMGLMREYFAKVDAAKGDKPCSS